MKKLIEEIKTYIPTSNQEVIDKETIIKALLKDDNILYRTNKLAHITSSGFIVNEDLTKTLMIFHNIYQNWGWTGGHADGNSNLQDVALKEAKEETGIKNVTFLSKKIGSIDILPVPAHFKNGEYIGNHLHLSIAYVLITNEDEPLRAKEDENAGVEWQPIDKLKEIVKEEIMHAVYDKLIAFSRREKNDKTK